jgi:hypothetical protein
MSAAPAASTRTPVTDRPVMSPPVNGKSLVDCFGVVVLGTVGTGTVCEVQGCGLPPAP